MFKILSVRLIDKPQLTNNNLAKSAFHSLLSILDMARVPGSSQSPPSFSVLFFLALTARCTFNMRE